MFTPWSFSPLVLRPALWLDASDASTLWNATSGGSLVAAGGSVVRWEDKSGNARHATQSTGTAQPTRQTSVQNGRDVIRFDGANDAMRTAGFSLLSHTIIAVAKTTAVSGLDVVFNMGTTNNYEREAALGFNGSSVYVNRSTGGYPTATASGVANTWRIIGGTGSSTQLIAYNNGIAGTPVTTSTATTTSNRIGSVGSMVEINATIYPLSGDIAELLVFDSVLSTTNRQTIERYLATKWGITI